MRPALSYSHTQNLKLIENYTLNIKHYYGGSKLNEATGNYETMFRDYACPSGAKRRRDPALGRMTGVDMMAEKYASVSPYNFSFNDPVGMNDPSGADPDYLETQYAYDGGYKGHRIMYDDVYFGKDLGMPVINVGGAWQVMDPGNHITYGNGGWADEFMTFNERVAFLSTSDAQAYYSGLSNSDRAGLARSVGTNVTKEFRGYLSTGNTLTSNGQLVNSSGGAVGAVEAAFSMLSASHFGTGIGFTYIPGVNGNTQNIMNTKMAGLGQLASGINLPNGGLMTALEMPEIRKLEVVSSYLKVQGNPIPGKNGITGTVTWMNIMSDGSAVADESWSFRSGSITLMPIPNGTWSVSNYRARSENGYVRNGVGFTFDITPDPAFGRSSLRIHPDGGPVGTAGCIGLTEPASRLNGFSSKMQEYLQNHSAIPMIVTGSYSSLNPVRIQGDWIPPIEGDYWWK